MKPTALLALSITILLSCNENKEAIIQEKVERYFSAWNRQDFESPNFSLFKNDTSYTWHGTKEGSGNRSIFNPNSGWKQWDKAWNGTYAFNNPKIDIDEMKVSGDFNETTDFLKLIGMSEGFSATVTFWFDDNYRVKETLYAWNPDNRSMHDQIKPLVEWAKENDSTTIHQIYIQSGFKPSLKAAKKWEKLLDSYIKAGGEFPN